MSKIHRDRGQRQTDQTPNSILPKGMIAQVVTLTPLSFIDTIQFWTGLQVSTTDPTRFVCDLVARIIDAEKQQQAPRLAAGKSSSSSSSQQVNERALWAWGYTLRFVDLFYSLDTTGDAFKKIGMRYDALRVEQRAVSATAVECDRLVKFLARSPTEKASALTASIVMECGFVNSIDSALVSTGGQRDLSFSVLREDSFVYLRILASLARGKDGARSVFAEVVRQLGAQVALIRANPQITNTAVGNVMALLHMLREAICAYPCADVPILREALVAVRAFTGWPLPYGPHAQRVENAVLAELEVPGASVRTRILAENPLLTPFGAEQADKHGGAGVDWARNNRVVTVLHNPNIPRALTLRKMIGRPVPRNPTYLTEMHTVREELLVSAFETTLVNTNPGHWHAQLVSALRNKHASDVNEWFDRVMVALGHNQEFSGPPSPRLALEKKRVNDAAILSVLRTISPTLTEQTSPSPSLNTWIGLNEPGRRGGDLEDDEEEDEERPRASKTVLGVALAPAAASGSAQYWLHTVPRVPELYFEFLELATLGDSSSSRGAAKGRRGRTEYGQSVAFLGGSVGNFDERPPPGEAPQAKKSMIGGRRASKRQPNKGRPSYAIPGLETFRGGGIGEDMNEEDFTPGAGAAFHKCPQHYVMYHHDYKELLHDARNVLPPDQLEGDSAERARIAAGRPKGVLCRVLLGGREVLHRAVATYVALRAMEPELCSSIEFRFYVVPLGRNDLAAFIAQRDGWYRRHVYIPFHGPLVMLPFVKYADAVDVEALEFSTFAHERNGSFTSAEGVGVGGKTHPSASTLSGSVVGGGKNNQVSNLQSWASRHDYAGGGLEPEDAPSSVSSRVGDSGPLHNNNTNNPGQQPGGSEIESSRADEDETVAKAHRFDAHPMKMLRHLLAEYVRSAKCSFPVFLYDCECWESPDAIETERGPDLTVPFCTRVEFGLGAAIAEHTNSEDFATNFSGDATAEGLGPDFSLSEILVDKAFIKAVSGQQPSLKVITPELTVSMFRMDVDGTLHASQARDVMELNDPSYLSLVVSSIPRFTLPLASAGSQVAVESHEPPATAAHPGFPWLEVQSVVARNNVVDLIKKKDKKDRDVDLIRDHLKFDARTHHVGLVDVRASNASRIPFSIAVDGKNFGPFYRVRVRGSTALSTSGGQAMFARAPPLHLPVQTFSPLDVSAVLGEPPI